MSTPTVLACNLSPERAARIRGLCAVWKLRFHAVPPEAFGEPVGALAGVLAPTGAPAPEAPFAEEMLVLCHLREQALQGFLHGFRRAAIPPVALKAVLTPTNAAWTAQALHDELRREHEAMQRQR